MKFLSLLFLLALPQFAFAQAGPDLSAGLNVEYFTKLRMDYAKAPKTEFFPGWNQAPEAQALQKAYEDGKIDEAIKLGDAWLKTCPIDADSQLLLAMCFKEKGNMNAYMYHLGIFYGLLQSITAGKDGLTPETAYVVVSVQEEYSFFQEIGAKVVQQSLVSGPCDKMELSRHDGDVKFTLYFNVAIPMKAVGDAIDKESK